ncbi:hydroxypyruvate isomerase-like protein Gip [Lycorma delicatula]|uniref:hydroxypyruvate isomerase-like protein Gip n=1 Tax=Lycorma delicatula TaxID=130591 RepID=UPI003F512B5B
MVLKFAANLSFLFQEITTSVIEKYALAQQAGFKAVESGNIYDYKIDEVVEAKTRANVEQIMINVFSGDNKKGEFGFAAIPGKEEEFKKSIDLSIKYAKALKCKKIHIMAGVVHNPTAENDDTYEKNLSMASKLLEVEGITGLIEPINPYSLPGYYLNNYEKCINILKKIDSDSLKLQLDIFHLQLITGKLTINIREFMPYTGHIQVAQVPNRDEPDSPGEINYNYIFKIIEGTPYGVNDYIGLEYNTRDDSIKNINWVHDFGYKL